MSGSVTKGKDSPSQSVQMMGRPLMTPDELKSLPKGDFIVMKTGMHPMRTHLHLFLDWGIKFEKPYILPEKTTRKVAYASKGELMQAIKEQQKQIEVQEQAAEASAAAGGGAKQTQEESVQIVIEPEEKHRIPYNLKE